MNPKYSALLLTIVVSIFQSSSASALVKCIVYDGTYFFAAQEASYMASYETAMLACEANRQNPAVTRGPYDCQLFEECKFTYNSGNREIPVLPKRESRTYFGSCTARLIRNGCETVYSGAGMVTSDPSCRCP